MVIVVETGMITPPFGINVFILKSLVGSDVQGVSIVFRGVAPFVIADLIKLALIVIFPALVMWLPSTMFRTPLCPSVPLRTNWRKTAIRPLSVAPRRSVIMTVGCKGNPKCR